MPPENQQPQPNPAPGPSTQPSNPLLQQPEVPGVQPEPAVLTAPDAGSIPPASPFVPQSNPKSKKSKKYLWVGAMTLAVLLLLGGYAFAIYLPNTPSHVYSSSLANTGLALDKLLDYSKQQQQANYTSVSFNGKVNVKSPGGSFDATVKGSGDKNNASVQASGDFLGEQLSADVRVVTAKGNTSPDVYLQVSGVKKFLDAEGLSSLGKLDGQWIAIDHTIIDTYKSTLQQDLKSTTGSDVAGATNLPTYTQAQDAAQKVQAVNKQYLFTSDSSKAVLTNEQYLSKATVNGQTLYHYKVGYNKTHLQQYVTALGQALDSSQLNDWSKQANNGKRLSEVMNLDALHDSINSANGKYTFDIWANKGTKLISKVAFTDPKSKDVVAISQDYTGGSKYPLGLSFSGKNDAGDQEKGALNITLDSATNKVAVTFSDNTKSSDGTTNVSGNFNVTPSKSPVTVVAPKGAKSVIDILNSYGLGGLVSGASPSSASSSPVDSTPFSQTSIPLRQPVSIPGRI